MDLSIGGRGADGIRRSLLQKLENAQRQADRGKRHGAMGALRAFINEVQALPARRITPADEQALISAANRILATL